MTSQSNLLPAAIDIGSSAIRMDGTYERIAPTGWEKIRAQEYLHKQALNEHQRSKSLTPERFIPIEEDGPQ
ncbi:MAG: hypothetical protein P8Z37_06250 [Acidobacteriota bacterium]